ncbi:ribulose-5-phosphate 3-epimerase [Encephalitozoon hellem ATCC 50504]|uniref:Ribulose-phosphate 3-epimerase n=1 Tax=Encephalitozoon hellem TaxID=27973 RepID=A0A9Q9C3D2_ENCHE|nr:ribulose-5-phosphate 3-epimerase [Encephalitozoon hellem ATCC 50504]AFM98469.1 ribulose-5-phosphate 3-epimerase [Encephalitozoon hellem ATCC 50504]UTX43394.1 ribulose-phosphate 3-epimerase [Encephalitozoon hellem]WEL38858.1 D-ribulose-phosphate 3 epimerase [Encephalitozoon hellem]|eukprot:XP_003887450.1 ribulose-5-phosphate 3-epimerase [Encephalitozoon hellem ATCC 50504]
MLRRRVGISILDCDFIRLEEELRGLKANGVSNIHLDVMDTTFVNNITFGPCVINKILEHNFVFDIHMMVESPLNIIMQINLEKVSLVTIHHEISNKAGVREYLRQKGVLFGIAINPETQVEEVEVEDVDFILVMSVKPGFGGQKFQESCLAKIEEIRRHGKMVGIDGGIGMGNIDKVTGADYIIVGSGYFRSEDRKRFLCSITERFLGEACSEGDSFLRSP